jgi:hypothetical protein
MFDVVHWETTQCQEHRNLRKNKRWKAMAEAIVEGHNNFGMV